MLPGESASIHEPSRELLPLQGLQETWARQTQSANDECSPSSYTYWELLRQKILAAPSTTFSFVEELEITISEVWSMMRVENKHAGFFAC